MSRLSCSVGVQLVVVGLLTAAGALFNGVGPSVGKRLGPVSIDGAGGKPCGSLGFPG